MERARGTLTMAGSRRGWLDFPRMRETWKVGAGGWGKCSACSCRGHTRNRIIDSPDSTPVLLPLLVSSSAGGARDEENQGIMEELHTCAASPMLYYINHEYSRTYPSSLYNRRVREGRKVVRGEDEWNVRADARSRIHRGMLKGITVCTRYAVPRRYSRERGRDKYSLPCRWSVSKWLERKHVSLCEKELAGGARCVRFQSRANLSIGWIPRIFRNIKLCDVNVGTVILTMVGTIRIKRYETHEIYNVV